jgi:hypothetical protein
MMAGYRIPLLAMRRVSVLGWESFPTAFDVPDKNHLLLQLPIRVVLWTDLVIHIEELLLWMVGTR